VLPRTCSSAPDLASLLRWAPMLPRGPSLASPRGELRCCHVPHGPQRAVDHRNKEGPSCPRHAVGTLKTGYPRIQALSQDKEQDVHPRTAT
jgi:hypothetical protein